MTGDRRSPVGVLACGYHAARQETTRGMLQPGEPAPPAELEEIRRRLLQAVRRLCPSWLADRREDLVQDAMLRVVDVLRRDPERQLNNAYLRRTAYSALVDEIRRVRRRRETSLEGYGSGSGDGEPAPLQPLSELPDPEASSAGRQLGGAIQDCLGRLVPPRRHAVVLYLQGHGVPDSARLLGWDAKRTSNLVYRALDDLRRCLGAKGYEA